jgi:hypothetical protein
MTTPDPSSSLHTKLQTILDDVFMAGLGIAGADDIEPEDHDRAILNTQKHYTTEGMAQILQAFEEANWTPPIPEIEEDITTEYTISSVEVIEPNTARVKINGKVYMTGQQFYDRFKAELGFSAATRTEVVLKAAKRAAGVSDD